MEIKSAFANGLLGVQRGMRGLDRNAAEIARVSATAPEQRQGADYAEALVDSKLNRTQVEASATVIRRVDETLGSLLDELA